MGKAESEKRKAEISSQPTVRTDNDNPPVLRSSFVFGFVNA